MRKYNVYEIKDLVDFTDEEGYGKFLDLHHIYMKFCNLKQFQVCTVIGVLTIRLLGGGVLCIENRLPHLPVYV